MVLVIIPAHNEEKNIGRVLRGLFEHGWKNILVINDGSSDKTAKIAKEAGVMVLEHAINRGQGAALETGQEWARQNGAEIVVHFDADDQFNVSDIAPAVEKLKQGYFDVVLGSRFIDSRSRVPLIKRLFIIPVGRLVNYIFAGIWLSDAHNGFRVLNKNALNAIKLSQDGMAHASQILKIIKNKKLKFTEHPVEVRYHEFGQGILGGFKVIWDLIMH